MASVAFAAILVALGGIGILAVVQERADDDEVVEAEVRAAFASVGERVRVTCRRSGDRWRCSYVNRKGEGSLVVGDSEHPEISIIR